MRKLRHREVKCLSQGYTIVKSQDLNTSNLAPEPLFLFLFLLEPLFFKLCHVMSRRDFYSYKGHFKIKQAFNMAFGKIHLNQSKKQSENVWAQSNDH